jgi:hypothetical protein
MRILVIEDEAVLRETLASNARFGRHALDQEFLQRWLISLSAIPR